MHDSGEVKTEAKKHALSKKKVEVGGLARGKGVGAL